MGRAISGTIRGAKRFANVFSFAVVTLAFAGHASALTAERVASGLTQPVYVTAPPGDTTHIYIVQQTGRIMRLDLTNGQLSTFFTIGGLTSTSGEQGLLGLAFDPNWQVWMRLSCRAGFPMATTCGPAPSRGSRR